LGFEANQGLTDPEVKFLSRGRGYSLFLTANEAVLALAEPSQQSTVDSRKSAGSADLFPRSAAFAEFLESRTAEFKNNSALQEQTRTPNPEPQIPAVLRLKLVGTNPAAQVTALDELPGKSNYFLGNDPKKWRTNVPNYAKVQYKEVYPGVDLVYYGNQRQLEYDFVVAPGADPKAIRLGFETGNSKLETGDSKLETRNSKFAPPLRIDADGDLVVSIEGGELRFHKPVVYQSRNSVYAAGSSQFTIQNSELLDGRYVLLADNRVGFEVAAYDRSKPLIIDPVLSYSTYLGGSQEDTPQAIAVDSSGSAYVTGRTYSLDFPTHGPFQSSNAGSSDVFVTKLNANGSALVYSTYLGGSDYDRAYAVAIDASGNAYVVGRTASTDFPTQNALQASNAGLSDVFVAKLDANGSSLVFSTYLGGSGTDHGYGISVDSSGNAFLTGWTDSTDFPTQAALQTSNAGLSDVFVAKLDASGSSLTFSTYLGGSGYEEATGIAVDTSGNAYLTGYTVSPDFPTTPGALDTTCGTDGTCNLVSGQPIGDAFVVKVNSSGSALVYSTFVGGSDADLAHAVAVDPSGNAFLVGSTQSFDFPTTVGAFDRSCGTDGYCNTWETGLPQDVVFVAKLNAAGSGLIYSTYIDGNRDHGGRGLALDSSGNAYVTGTTDSADFPAVSPVQGTNAGEFDAFVTKLNAAGSALVFSTYLGGAAWDDATGIAVDSYGNVYITGYSGSTDFPMVNAFQGYNRGGDDGFVAKLSGLTLPAVTLSPSTLAFGDQLVGTTSTAQTVTLANKGDAPLTISSIATTGDFAGSNTCPTTLEPGTNCTIDVTFTPTVLGYQDGALTVTDSVVGVSGSATLSGRGVSTGVVGSLPTTLTFPDQVVGTTSPPQTVPLTNTGTGPLGISFIIVDATDFAQTNDCPVSPATLAVAASCTISVTFTPRVGGTIVGTLYVYSDAAGSPHQVTLSGIGLVPPALNDNFANATVIPSSPFTRGVDTAAATTELGDPTPSCATGSRAKSVWYQFTPPTDGTVDANTYGSSYETLLSVWTGSPGALSEVACSAYQVAFAVLGGTTYSFMITAPYDDGGTLIFNLLLGTPNAIISNDLIQMGINAEGHLDVPGGTPSSGSGTSYVGLRYLPTGAEVAAPGCLCEGWGAADALTSTTGWANESWGGTSGFTLEGFVFDASTAKSTVRIGNTLRVTHFYHPSPTPNLYQVDVSIENISSAPVDLRYRRVVDWDVEPTAFDEFVTLQAAGVPSIVFTSNNGFASPDPLSGPSDLGSTGSFTDVGPMDQGALFDFNFGTLAAGATKGFRLFYGAAATEAEADAALQAVGAEAFSYGQPNTPDGPTLGTPNTFILAFVTAEPAVSLSPISLDFGNQILGTTSAPQTITLTNSGTATLNISSIAATGDFGQTNTCGTSLAASANCTISVSFTPTTTAGARSGTLTITDTAPGSPHTVTLSGTGVVAPAVTLSVEVLTFQHNINIDCPPKTVALTNSGTGPLAITSIVATGDFTQTNTCGTSLAAGASCDISVTFKPTAEGLVAGAVTITDNAADSAQIVALAGTGLPPCLLITSAQTATVVRGMDSTAFSISDPKPSCHTSAIGLACQRTGPVSCLFNPQTIPPSGSSALTLRNLKALAADALNFRVTGTSGRDTTALDLVVLVSDFSFNTSPASVTLEAGQTASYSLAIAPSNRLTGTVQLSCSGAPAGTRCAVSPSAVTLDGSKPGQANVQVTTTARALASPGGGDGRYGRPGGSPLLWLLALVGLAALLAVWRLRALKPAPTLALAGMLLLILVWAACGGGGGFVSTNGPSGTPAGSYSLKITGTYTSTSAGTTLSHDTTLTLKVN
jgi:hypothetical protein